MRRIITIKKFDDAVTALQSPAAARLIGELGLYLAEKPEHGSAVAGVGVSVLHSRAYGEYPAVRLFYGYNNNVLYLLDVAPFDELEVFDEESAYAGTAV